MTAIAVAPLPVCARSMMLRQSNIGARRGDQELRVTLRKGAV